MKTVISVVNMGESVRHEVYKRNLGIGNPKWRETMRRKTRLNVLVPAILCAFPSAVFATAWGVQTLITGYYVYDAGSAFIRVANMQNPDGCTSNAYLVLNSSAPNFNAMWAQVIAAQATGSTVALRYNGCAGNYPKIDAVAVPDKW